MTADNKDNTNLEKGWQNEGKWRQLGGEDPVAVPQPGGCGQVSCPRKLTPNMPLETNVADRIIMALIKTGKTEVASDNSALDTSSVYWSDMQEREDSQTGHPGEQRLTAGAG